MAQTSEEPKLSLRLVIDDEKNKVIFAEAGKDFVDVLCSFLTLPMGTIVRLLEKNQKSQFSTVGCFDNLYKSVSDMSVDDFETQACKQLLLYPRSIKDNHCRKLKLNVNDTEVTKFFVCPNIVSQMSCSKIYSNFPTSRCSCGQLMKREIPLQEGENFDGCLGNAVDGVFISCRTSFIITDDLKVALNSMGLVLNVLNDLGYDGFDKLREMFLDVSLEEVLTLLACLFTSETPLTDAFLRKHCMSRKRKMLTPLHKEDEVLVEADQFLTLKVFVKKVDMTILYAECREEFVDFLFTLLAIPLEFAWELSIDAPNLGCIGNLCRSVKGLSFKEQGEPTVSKCVLPHYYNLSTKLLDIAIEKPPEYECLLGPYSFSNCNFTKKVRDAPSNGQRIAKLISVDPKSMFSSTYSSKLGFVKGETNFIVSDDLMVTPIYSSSTYSLLSKLQMKISDIEEQVIKVNRAEAISLLRASLITTSALTNAFSNFLSKSKSTSKIPKSEESH